MRAIRKEIRLRNRMTELVLRMRSVRRTMVLVQRKALERRKTAWVLRKTALERRTTELAHKLKRHSQIYIHRTAFSVDRHL